MLDTKRRDRNHARVRRQNQVDYQHSVLLAAFNDVARLHINLFTRNVFNRELIDFTCFAHNDFFLKQRFFQSQKGLSFNFVFAMDQKNSQIALCEWSLQFVFVVGGFLCPVFTPCVHQRQRH